MQRGADFLWGLGHDTTLEKEGAIDVIQQQQESKRQVPSAPSRVDKLVLIRTLQSVKKNKNLDIRAVSFSFYLLLYVHF